MKIPPERVKLPCFGATSQLPVSLHDTVSSAGEGVVTVKLAQDKDKDEDRTKTKTKTGQRQRHRRRRSTDKSKDKDLDDTCKLKDKETDTDKRQRCFSTCLDYFYLPLSVVYIKAVYFTASWCGPCKTIGRFLHVCLLFLFEFVLLPLVLSVVRFVHLSFVILSLYVSFFAYFSVVFCLFIGLSGTFVMCLLPVKPVFVSLSLVSGHIVSCVFVFVYFFFFSRSVYIVSVSSSWNELCLSMQVSFLYLIFDRSYL